MNFRILYLVIIAIFVVVVTVLVFNNYTDSNKKEFDVDIDALKEEQSLFIHTRGKITNTGKQPLTNILIDYGNKSETIVILNPGQTYPLSPPPGSDLQRIIVTSDEGINVTKEYRTPIKIPGMMGS